MHSVEIDVFGVPVTIETGKLAKQANGSVVVKAGESFVIPAGTVHDAHNDGSAPANLVGVYVVEKGKPLATPAP